MISKTTIAAGLFLTLAVGCGQAPLKPAAQHIRIDESPAEGTIPPPVQLTPMLPKPRPTAAPETYSVVVSRVPVSPP